MIDQTLTFGDLGAELWGALGALGDQRFALLGDHVRAEIRDELVINGSTADDDWVLAGGGIELECTGLGEPAIHADGFDQLVSVRGGLPVGGVPIEVDVLGCRGVREHVEPARVEAVRHACCWFGRDLGFALTAARPRGSGGHATDHVSASVFEDGRSLAVSDPRLSTTYTADGDPTRASFELWLERSQDHSHDDQVQDGEEFEPYPRRAAGEAIGVSGTASAGAVRAQAAPFRWHARGREGAGVYVLAKLNRA